MNSQNRTVLVVVAALVVVGLAGLVAMLFAGGDDDETGATETPVSAPGPAIGETLPVEVTGQPLPSLEDEAADPAVGQPMPVISGLQFDGSGITVGGPGDGPRMYVFLAHWCPHCNAEIPELIELQQRGDIPADLEVVGISTAVASDRDNYPPSEWVFEKGWPWPVMADDDMATAFIVAGGSGFPYTVLTDSAGNVLARADGSRPADAIKDWLDVKLTVAAS